jgi:phage head maturation protease
MLARLIGCAVPYGVASTNATSPSGARERIEPGAFDQQCLDDAELTHVNINHKRPAIADAQVRLMNGHAGLYFNVLLPDNAQARALMHRRSEWRGISLGWQHADATTEMHWPTGTNLVFQISWITNIAIIVGADHEPAYPGTWVAENSAAAIERVKRENHDACVRIWGSSYKRLPRESWGLPLQSTTLETKLRAKDPERTHWIVMPWGCGSLVREYRT